MEALIELVAASFIRNNIECPTADSNAKWVRPADPKPTTALPDHTFKKKEAELAT